VESHFLNEIDIAGLLINYHYFNGASNEEPIFIDALAVTKVLSGQNTCLDSLPTNEETAVLRPSEKTTYETALSGSSDTTVRYYAGSMLIRSALVDTSDLSLSTVRALLDSLGGLQQKFAKLDSWLQVEEPDSATLVLNEISAISGSLDSIEQIEWSHFYALKSNQIDAMKLGQSDSLWVTTELDSLEEIAEVGYYHASIQAQNLVNRMNPDVYNRPITLPTSTERALRIVPLQEEGKQTQLLLIPNPASESVTVRILGNKEESKFSRLQLVDVMGKTWKRINLQNKEFATLQIDLRQIPSGWYIVQILSEDDKTILSSSLFIE